MYTLFVILIVAVAFLMMLIDSSRNPKGADCRRTSLLPTSWQALGKRQTSSKK